MNELIPFRRRGLIQPFWDKFSSMEKEFDRMFNDPFFSDAFKFPISRTSSLPKINIKELDDKYVVEVAIPGYDKENIDLFINDNKLFIEGTQQSKSEKNDKYIFREISKRSFHRIIPFPKEIKDENVVAESKNGMIVLTLQKREKVQKQKRGKKIKIR